MPFESRIQSNIYFLQILTNVKRVAQLCAFALIVRMETVELTLTHMAVILNCSCANGYRLLGKTNCVGMLVAQLNATGHGCLLHRLSQGLVGSTERARSARGE